MLICLPLERLRPGAVPIGAPTFVSIGSKNNASHARSADQRNGRRRPSLVGRFLTLWPSRLQSRSSRQSDSPKIRFPFLTTPMRRRLAGGC